MAIRFRRSIQIAPGIRLNLGKRGASVRVGGRGFGVTTGTPGTRVSVGMPGTGLYATEKVGTVKRSATHASTPSPAGDAPYVLMTLDDAARAVPPTEPGLGFPTWWLVGAAGCLIAAYSSSGASLLLAAPCGYMVWQRLASRKYQAFKAVRSAQASPSECNDARVREAVALAPESWSVQREAGRYFHDRQMLADAASCLTEAARLFPGDKRLYAVLAAGAARDANCADDAIHLLEPYLAGADPDADEVDVVVVAVLAHALHVHGDSARALEVVKRLPLRRHNLDQPLLLGLCVRAMAKHALGQKVDAKRDLDRIYAADPGFSMVPEVEAALAE